MVILPVFSLFLFTLSVQACYVTNCVSSLSDGQCFSSNKRSQTFSIQSCPSGQKCSIDKTSSSMLYDFTKDSYSCVAQDWIPSLKYPGEFCQRPEECSTGNCGARGVCKGRGQGEICKAHEDCDVGLVCLGGLSSFCTPQVAAGGSCTMDDACANDSLCFNRRCTLLFSLPDGTLLQDVSSENPLLCVSGFVAQSRCYAAPKNEKKANEPCYGDRECVVTFPDGQVDNSRCLCGMNSRGYSFCQAAAGDAEFTPFKNGLLAVRSSNNKCHYSTSFSARCPELSQDVSFQQFIDAYYNYIYRHSIVGAPDCLQSIMPFASSSGYLSVASDGSSSTSDKTVIIVVVVVVFFVILMSGVVCFVCVRRCAVEDRSEDAMRRRILRQEMDQLEVRNGRVVKTTESTEPWMPAFKGEELLLDQKDKRFVRTGIPIAQEVDPRNLDQLLLPEETSDIPLACSLFTSVNVSKIEVTAIDSSEHQSPSVLFTKSKPSTARVES